MKTTRGFVLAALAVGMFALSSCGDDSGSGDAGADTDTDTDVDMDTDTDTDSDSDTDADSDTDGDTDTDTDSETEAIETWTDSSSELTWQVSPPDEEMTWEEAIAYCQELSDGGWHLPTISELRTLIRGCEGTVTGGSCGVTDSCLSIASCQSGCDSCEIGGGPNDGCYGPSELPDEYECEHFWSSSAVTDGFDGWSVLFDYGYVSYPNADGHDDKYARCVR